MDGAILSYTPASGWTQIHNNDNFYCIIDMAPQGETSTGYPPPPFPTFLAGFNDGAVSLFRGGTEYPLQPSTGNRVQFISANWNYGADPGNVIYVYSQNYQFTYGYGSNVGYLYPAIPSVSSACGDIDGDGKADLVIAIGPNWYTWSSASKYKVRSGPYNMGISGTPKIADIDGDGLADLIVIVGSDWYVWFSSAGYQRFGPYMMSLP